MKVQPGDQSHARYCCKRIYNEKKENRTMSSHLAMQWLGSSSVAMVEESVSQSEQFRSKRAICSCRGMPQEAEWRGDTFSLFRWHDACDITPQVLPRARRTSCGHVLRANRTADHLREGGSERTRTAQGEYHHHSSFYVLSPCFCACHAPKLTLVLYLVLYR